MGSPSSVETSVSADDRQRGSHRLSAPFRQVAVCVDGSRMVEPLVLHAAKAAAAFGVPLTNLGVLEPDSNADANPPNPLDWGVPAGGAHF
jgi:K+-sensing histidine kinase KdpD